MAIGYGIPSPKPARGEDRITRRRTREAQATKFRDHIWKRQRAASDDGYAYCQRCGAGPLLRTLDVLHPLAGHVAHNRGRNVAPEDRYNPDAATLQCRTCHLDSHAMRFAQ